MEINGVKHIRYEIILERGDSIDFYLADGETHRLQIDNWMAGHATLVGYACEGDIEYDEELEFFPTILGAYLGPASRVISFDSVKVNLRSSAPKARRR